MAKGVDRPTAARANACLKGEEEEEVERMRRRMRRRRSKRMRRSVLSEVLSY